MIGLRHPLLFPALLMVLTACSSLTRNPVPVNLMHEAVLPGMDQVRVQWDRGRIDPVMQQDLVTSVKTESRERFPLNADGQPSYAGLAISGGGSSGAYGAGVLCGWTAAGTRPVFKLVTGISTGALIAPYAFLGPAYDDQLRRAYTTISTEDVARISRRPPWRAEALQDTAPLAELIARDVTESMLSDIVAAHAAGQRLYIGTVNLDAQRFVVWNMGAIASSGAPGALELFRKVMLASASIPGAFPPVLIDVEVSGHNYDEMHVDGGTMNQVFFYEFMLDLRAAVTETSGSRESTRVDSAVYVIRNGRIRPEPEAVERDLLKITNRALSTAILSASLNDIMRIYQATQRDGIDFHYTAIPAGFEMEAQETFDPEQMNALFDLGYRLARDGKAWQESPLDSSAP